MGCDQKNPAPSPKLHEFRAIARNPARQFAAPGAEDHGAGRAANGILGIVSRQNPRPETCSAGRRNGDH
jgi:hypothetical protein